MFFHQFFLFLNHFDAKKMHNDAKMFDKEGELLLLNADSSPNTGLTHLKGSNLYCFMKQNNQSQFSS